MKKTEGRRKIEIKKIQKKSRQQVTFSKRRAGLFNKAAELSVLCGAEIAILVFSPTGKIFTFAHPNVDSLLDRFLTGHFPPPKPAESYLPLAELNRDFAYAAAEFDAEKTRAAEVEETLRNGGRFWWDEPLQCMKLEELKRFRSSLLELRAKVAERADKLAAVRMEGPLMPALPPPLIDLVEDLSCPPPSSGNLSVATETGDVGLGFF